MSFTYEEYQQAKAKVDNLEDRLSEVNGSIDELQDEQYELETDLNLARKVLEATYANLDPMALAELEADEEAKRSIRRQNRLIRARYGKTNIETIADWWQR